ncbi:MAG: hypothetical protein IT373_17100 [Polyangiaceae bacterium]|nr:hypothetical protein [Polyangiaceae bacterium]
MPVEVVVLVVEVVDVEVEVEVEVVEVVEVVDVVDVVELVDVLVVLAPLPPKPVEVIFCAQPAWVAEPARTRAATAKKERFMVGLLAGTGGEGRENASSTSIEARSPPQPGARAAA